MLFLTVYTYRWWATFASPGRRYLVASTTGTLKPPGMTPTGTSEKKNERLETNGNIQTNRNMAHRRYFTKGNEGWLLCVKCCVGSPFGMLIGSSMGRAAYLLPGAGGGGRHNISRYFVTDKIAGYKLMATFWSPALIDISPDPGSDYRGVTTATYFGLFSFVHMRATSR